MTISKCANKSYPRADQFFLVNTAEQGRISVFPESVNNLDCDVEGIAGLCDAFNGTAKASPASWPSRERHRTCGN